MEKQFCFDYEHYAALSELSEAGLLLPELEVVDDPTRGMMIMAVAASGSQAETARRSLGRLPFNHEVRLSA